MLLVSICCCLFAARCLLLFVGCGLLVFVVVSDLLCDVVLNVSRVLFVVVCFYCS